MDPSRAEDLPAYRFDVDRHAADIAAEWGTLAPGERGTAPVSCAGRLMLVRHHGGLIFAVLQDRTARMQLFVDRAAVGDELHARFGALRRGDWVGVTGPVMRTDRGELSIAVTELTLLGRAARRPPDKDKAFDDIEARSRRRYVDLMVNERTRETFRIRRAVIDSIRDGLRARGFWEVEGPMLQSIQGGATARPFITHHNALDLDLYLRIALELHLKRLIVGGMERVFELSRVFRNEGIDVRHNPEFTMLEAYQAFADYGDMMELVESLVVSAARAALGDHLVVTVGDRRIDLAPPWPRITLDELIRTRLGVSMDPTMPVDEARAILDGLGVEWEPGWGSGKLMKQVVDERIQHEIIEPVFCVDYPEEVSPLARLHRSRPGYVERFELMVAGFELCNAYSEQNDPVAQLAAFEAEARAKAQGDPEAGDIDEDYVQALEYGLPATGGLGIGIDRLVMLLSGAGNIREVVLFPTLRPIGGGRSLGAGHPLGLGRLADRDGTVPAAPPVATAGPAQAGPVPAEPIMRPDAPPDTRPAQRSRRPVLALAWLTLIGGVIQLLPLVPVLHSRLQADPIGPLWFRVTGHLVSTLLGLLLILLAGQVARGKRRAWQLSLILFGAGAAVNALKGPHPVSLAYCLVMLAALLAYDSRFRGRSDPPSLLRLVRLVPLYVAAVLLFGFVTLALGRHQLGAPLTFLGGLETIARGLIGLPGPYDYAHPFFDAYFRGALLALGVAGALGAAFLLFRPFQARQPHSPQSWERARRLVHSYGSDTLAYFTLRPDKSFFFGSDGEAFLAYTYLGGYALVSGDPIGAGASVDRLLDEFLAFCDDRSWKVAFLGARGSESARYTARGLHSFYLGDEAIVECQRFTLEGAGMKGVRAAVNRVGRTHRFELLRESQASPQLVAALNGISARWRGKAPERGFTMSLSQDVEGNGRNPEFLLCVALDEDDRPSGFLRLVPAYGEDFGYTLDLMRHLPDAPNGMTEFLIARTAEALRAEGIDRLSMNFAMWGRLYSDDIRYSPTQWLAKRAIDVLNPFFQIKSLRDFNEKFSPRWLGRVLVFQEPADLPQVGLLYAGAEGFLSIPVVGELFVPRAVGEESAVG
ncbi:lysine--tRNA ligase [Gryllotalpicola protaetiae]|uniref:Lysine--tRNA ligase n=1 Tax=Gryllotalpicola protaetiae TaxID=2419771 RepID=A0A387BM61_9MICO|nr:lysine--tRNA ligase [Gryllotalpicola protaetiae]AYG03758.1 lysine--tRNA ligase [Gryllotalpicola protaetiae]